jgi:hypothetical protein
MLSAVRWLASLVKLARMLDFHVKALTARVGPKVYLHDEDYILRRFVQFCRRL